MKSLLMISYHFPPAQNGGVQRSLRFFEYLPEFGWEPQVISTDLYGKSSDAIHTMELLSIYKRIRGKYPASASIINRKMQSNGKPTLLDIINEYVYVPDGSTAWLPFSLIPAYWQAADVIFTTSPPVSSHLQGLILQKLKRKPWVMDLRDPWTVEPVNNILVQSPWRLSLEQKIEKFCFKNAQTIILNTENAANAYREIYPDFTSKFQVITNGYDPKSFNKSNFSVRDYLGIGHDIKLISHVGTLARDVNISMKDVFVPILGAIKQFADRNIRFLFLGRVPASFVNAVFEMELQDIILMPEQIAHADAIQSMLSSDALLFFDPPGSGETYIRGKLYEYAASERPIIAIAEDGASTAFLQSLGNVLFASPHQQNEIEQIFRQVLENQVPARNTAFDLSTINYRHLTERLANILDQLA